MKRKSQVGDLTCRLIVCLVGALLLPSAISAKGPFIGPLQELIIKGDGGRPLADAILQLQERFHWQITYEDPPWSHPSELIDVTESVRRDGNMAKRVYSPRGGLFDFRRALPNDVAQHEEEILSDLLEQYNRSGNDGVFGLVRTGDIYHVVPTRAKNATATLVPYASLLDARVTIPAANRTALEMVVAITEALKGAGPRTVGVGTVPVNLLFNAKMPTAFRNEMARTALVKTLAVTKAKLSWRLLCDAGPGASLCFLNIHVVEGP